MKRIKTLRGVKPLICEDDRLVAAHINHVFMLTRSERKPTTLCKLPDPIHMQLLDRIPFWFRLRRSGVNAACAFNDDLIFCYRQHMYRFNQQTQAVVKDLTFSKGRGPLKLSVIEGIKCFDDCIAFGEYYNNPRKEPIRIFMRTKSSKWETPYTFADGQINHIHALAPDPYRNCVWILTGDFGDAAGIYQATNNFKSVKAVLRGDQRYRACVMFVTKTGLIYGTDTQLEDNAVMYAEESNGKWEAKPLQALNGSCIYGCELQDYYVFSTATEPGIGKGKLVSLLDNRPAIGIKENRSDVVLLSMHDGTFRVAYSRQKDFWPYRLFQFGSIQFPSGTNGTNFLYAYNVGSNINNLSTEIWDITT
jgi:hypothetical protein